MMKHRIQLRPCLPCAQGRKFGEVFSFVPDGTYISLILGPTDESVGYFLSPCRATNTTNRVGGCLARLSISSFYRHSSFVIRHCLITSSLFRP
jgi:hypothetical protein